MHASHLKRSRIHVCDLVEHLRVALEEAVQPEVRVERRLELAELLAAQACITWKRNTLTCSENSIRI